MQLELGGKGANIVFADANLTAAVNGSAFAIFHNQGQACIAGCRLVLHESIADEFLERFLALAGSIRLGNPLDPTTEMGPLTSPLHRDRVLSYVKVAVDEGGEILLGGKAPDDPALAKGCYIEPTVVRADPSSRVCQEEVFGPFVTVTHVRHRRRGAGHRQRHRLRPRRRAVDERPLAGAPHGVAPSAPAWCGSTPTSG